MGREWYNGGRYICSSKSKSKTSESNGCITALYHFFHHHYQPTFDSPSRYPKGLVAPRNSLELTDESPLSTNYKEKDSFNISVSGKKSNHRAVPFDTSSDHCNSPSTKKPNVVARLMGLDLLPNELGQRLSVNCSGLPESPRISSTRKSDADIRRLSLQLKHEESSSPGHNKRVITRRVGMDITNLLQKRRSEHLSEHRKVRSRFSQKENTFVLKQDKISHQPTKKLTLSKDSKKNLKSGNEHPLRPINVSKFSFHSTPNNGNKQRRAFISGTSTNSLEEEEERVVAEVERHIVDALLLEMVKMAAFEGLKDKNVVIYWVVVVGLVANKFAVKAI